MENSQNNNNKLYLPSPLKLSPSLNGITVISKLLLLTSSDGLCISSNNTPIALVASCSLIICGHKTLCSNAITINASLYVQCSNILNICRPTLICTSIFFDNVQYFKKIRRRRNVPHRHLCPAKYCNIQKCGSTKMMHWHQLLNRHHHHYNYDHKFRLPSSLSIHHKINYYFFCSSTSSAKKQSITYCSNSCYSPSISPSASLKSSSSSIQDHSIIGGGQCCLHHYHHHHNKQQTESNLVSFSSPFASSSMKPNNYNTIPINQTTVSLILNTHFPLSFFLNKFPTQSQFNVQSTATTISSTSSQPTLSTTIYLTPLLEIIMAQKSIITTITKILWLPRAFSSSSSSFIFYSSLSQSFFYSFFIWVSLFFSLHLFILFLWSSNTNS